MNKKLSVSAAATYRDEDPFRDMAGRLKQMGFSGAVVHWSRDWSDQYIQEIRSIFEQAGIEIQEVGAYCNLSHADPAVRKKNLDDVRYAITVADKLGCPAVASIVGSPAADEEFPWAMAPETYSKQTWKMVREILSEIASFTEGTCVKFLIEPYLLTCMDSPQAIRKMCDEVGHPNLGVLMDVVNIIHKVNYLQTGQFIDECFELMGDFIHLCHAKDIVCDPRNSLMTLREVTPGDGVLDYEAFIRNIVALDRHVPLMLEHLTEDSELLRARNYICRTAEDLGVEVI